MSLEVLLATVAASVTLAGFLVGVVNRLVEGLVTPLFEKFSWDKFWIMYISWAFGGGVIWLTGINFLAPFMPENVLAGKILSALVAGGGANLLHDFLDRQSTTTKSKSTNDKAVG